MKKLENIETVAELLNAFSDIQIPVIVNIRSDGSNNQFLMDRVANRMASNSSDTLDFYVLDKSDTSDIEKELMVMKSPILLVIYKGMIESVFSGNVSFKKIDDAVQLLFEKIKIKSPLAKQQADY